MALLRFLDGSDKSYPADEAIALWGVMNGEVTATSEQKKLCQTIKDIFLNWRTAPDSYIEAYKETIYGHAITDWMVDRDGKPTRPSDDFGWKFAKRWGLWYQGVASEIVTNFVRTGKIKLVEQQEIL